MPREKIELETFRKNQNLFSSKEAAKYMADMERDEPGSAERMGFENLLEKGYEILEQEKKANKDK